MERRFDVKDKLKKIVKTQSPADSEFKLFCFERLVSEEPPLNSAGVPIERGVVKKSRIYPNRSDGQLFILAAETGCTDLSGRKIYIAADRSVFVYYYRSGGPYSPDFGDVRRPYFGEEFGPIIRWADLKKESQSALARIKEKERRMMEKTKKAQAELEQKGKKLAYSSPEKYQAPEEIEFALPKTKRQVNYLKRVVIDALKSEGRWENFSVQPGERFFLDFSCFARVNQKVYFRLINNGWKYNLTGIASSGREVEFRRPIRAHLGELLSEEERQIVSLADSWLNWRFCQFPLFQSQVFWQGRLAASYNHSKWYLSLCGRYIRLEEDGSTLYYKVAAID